MSTRCFVLVVALLSFYMPAAAREMSEKKIYRQFAIKPGDKLVVDNVYGKVNLKPWNKNEMTVDIVITASAASLGAAQKLLDKVNIIESNTNGTISFKTSIEKGARVTKNSSYTIDYVINMPWKNAIDITNKFGDVNILDWDAPMDVDVAYGKLFVYGTHAATNIKVAFGTAEVYYADKAKFQISYSKLKIGSANSLDVVNKFGETEIDTVQDLLILQQYGDLKIGVVDNIEGNVSFADMRVAGVQKSMDMTLKYVGEATIKEFGANVNLINVKAQFSDVSMHIADGANLKMESTVSFGDLKNSAPHTYLGSTEPKGHRSGNVKRYQGKMGRGEGSMLVDVSYGNLTIK